MNTIYISSAHSPVPIVIGRRGENAVTQVIFDYASWANEFGDGVCTLLVKRSADENAYPVALTYDGDTATWLVTLTDTAYKGAGLAEFTYTVDEQIAKSAVFGIKVLADIGEPTETPPDPYETWLDTLTELEAATLQNAQDAQDAASDAASAKTAAETAQTASETAQGKAEAAQTAAETAQGKAESAQGKAEDAQEKAETAQGKAEDAQEIAGNYADDARGAMQAASQSADDALGYKNAAQENALKSEGYAVGTQNGTPVQSGTYYHNNAKYYCEQAQEAAAGVTQVSIVNDILTFTRGGNN